MRSLPTMDECVPLTTLVVENSTLVDTIRRSISLKLQIEDLIVPVKAGEVIHGPCDSAGVDTDLVTDLDKYVRVREKQGVLIGRILRDGLTLKQSDLSLFDGRALVVQVRTNRFHFV